MMPQRQRPRLYGRRKGRPLRARKSALMQELLPKLQIDIAQKPSAFDPRALFAPPPREVWLEIGFGGGEHLAGQAARHTDTGFIGCEPFVNGVASLLGHIDRERQENIRIFPDDARVLLNVLPDACMARCFVLFPDPWPKARHAERRFIGPENLARLARVLQPGAELRIATDDTKLAEWMRDCLRCTQEFEEVSVSSSPPADWIATRYEQKAVKTGRRPVYFSYRRV